MSDTTAQDIADAMVGSEKERVQILDDARLIVTISSVVPAVKKMRMRGERYFVVGDGSRGEFSFETRPYAVVRSDGVPGVLDLKSGDWYIIPTITTAILTIASFVGIAGGAVVLGTAGLLTTALGWFALDTLVLRRFHPWDDDPTDVHIIERLHETATALRKKYAGKAEQSSQRRNRSNG